MSESKKTLFSGMQATGIPHIGNYLGAIRNWQSLQADYNCLFCIVDMHSITIRQDPAALRKKARDLFCLYIACGIDPESSIIYYQSHIPGHAELSWILGCFTYMGELQRMTQFKDKSKNHADNINAGLFTYPVLMAADILLFGTDLVPVGDDQRQHLELTRDIAQRFNKIYGEVLTVPEAYYGKTGARIMSLQEPSKKMSKSETENMNNVVSLLDDPKVIMNKFKRAMTDSDTVVRYDLAEKPGISNLMSIYASCTGKTIAEAENDFAGSNYGTFKTAVGEAALSLIEPIQAEFKRLSAANDYIDKLIKEKAEKANRLSERTLNKVKRKVGFPDNRP